MLTCRKCEISKPSEEFSPTGVRERECRKCARVKYAMQRGKDETAKRLLYNLKSVMRKKNLEERVFWGLEHVEILLEKSIPPPSIAAAIKDGFIPKLRIVRINPNKPFVPNNARIKWS